MANASNIYAGKPRSAGSIYRAPAGTTLPTDATTALASGFVSMGYISEDGVVNNNAITSSDTKAWGGTVVMSSQTEKTDTFAFTMLETLNVDVLKAVYGSDNVTGTLETGITVKANDTPQESAAWCIEMTANGHIVRIVIPDAKISEIGEISYTDEEANGFAVTLTAVPDSAGQTHYTYISK